MRSKNKTWNKIHFFLEFFLYVFPNNKYKEDKQQLKYYISKIKDK